ncbi:MAG: GyrI-like domain-containing protein [Fimbriimonadaceae bacterium]|nr:GyrI-like domain-containing protein [Fimbriimonadaceae bacterium]
MLTQPRLEQTGPFRVVGCWCAFDGEDEGPGWTGAHGAFFPRIGEVADREGDLVFGFLYRPHKDHPEVAPSVRACFVGVGVRPEARVPPGMCESAFPEGTYVAVESVADDMGEAAEGVGEAVAACNGYAEANGWREGDACFAVAHGDEPKPPYREIVMMHLVRGT